MDRRILALCPKRLPAAQSSRAAAISSGDLATKFHHEHRLGERFASDEQEPRVGGASQLELVASGTEVVEDVGNEQHTVEARASFANE